MQLSKTVIDSSLQHRFPLGNTWKWQETAADMHDCPPSDLPAGEQGMRGDPTAAHPLFSGLTVLIYKMGQNAYSFSFALPLLFYFLNKNKLRMHAEIEIN